MSYYPDDHTREIIVQGLREALESWGLGEERQVALTTDSVANIVKAVQLNDWKRFQCFGHRLHLAIVKYESMYSLNNLFFELFIA